MPFSNSLILLLLHTLLSIVCQTLGRLVPSVIDATQEFSKLPNQNRLKSTFFSIQRYFTNNTRITIPPDANANANGTNISSKESEWAIYLSYLSNFLHKNIVMSLFHSISFRNSMVILVWFLLTCLLVTLFIEEGRGQYQVRVEESNASSPGNPNFISSRLVLFPLLRHMSIQVVCHTSTHIHTTRKR